MRVDGLLLVVLDVSVSFLDLRGVVSLSLPVASSARALAFVAFVMRRDVGGRQHNDDTIHPNGWVALHRHTSSTVHDETEGEKHGGSAVPDARETRARSAFASNSGLVFHVKAI